MRHFKFILIPFFSVLAFIGGIMPAYAVTIDWNEFLNASSTDSTGGGFGLIGNILSFLGSILSFLQNPANALAGFIAQAIVGVTVSILNAVTLVIGWILFGIANGLIELALELNSVISASSVVQTGFEIVLNIANLGLVVAIIAIAFMVMLRRPGATKLLPRFIAVALLINFSFLIITNFFLEPVNQITEVLRQAANFDFNSFGKIFVVDTLDFGTAASDILSVDLDISGWVAEATISLLGVLFFATFVLIGFIVLMSFAAMLIVRYVALSLLIILMPIAWIAWIFPGLKIPGGNPANVWWESFTRWLLFAPISMFFFFLAIQAATAGNILDPTKGVGAVAQIGIAAGNMFIVVGFLVGGLVVANKMSITGASYALATTKKLGAYARKYAGRKTYQVVTAPFREDKIKDEDMKDKSRTAKLLNRINPVRKDRMEKLQKSERLYTKIPLVGKGIKAGGRELMLAGAKSERTILAQASKKYESLEGGALMAAIAENKQASDLEQMALAAVAVKKGYGYEAPIAEFLVRAEEKGLFKKYGAVKTELDLSAEGLAPSVARALKKDGVSQETIDAAVAEVSNKISNSELSGKISTFLLGEWNEKTPQYGLTKGEFEMLRKSLTRYLIRERPNVLNSIRGRLPGPVQAYMNTELENYAKEGGEFESEAFAHMGTPGGRALTRIRTAKDPSKTVLFGDASARDKQLYIQNNWTKVKKDLSDIKKAAIKGRTDLSSTELAKEIAKINDKLEAIGPQGVIGNYIYRERARKGGFMLFGGSLATSSDTTTT